MLRPTRAAELRVSPDVDVDSLLASVRHEATLDLDVARTEDRVYLDTFDGRLHAAGMTAWRSNRSRSGAATVLEIALVDGQERSVEARPARRDRILACDLGDGPGSRELEGVIKERALLPQVRVRARVQPAAVRNGDGKTVARIVVEEPAVVTARGTDDLAPRLRLVAMRGYDGAFERLRAALGGRGDAVESGASIVDEAMAVIGLSAGGVSSKVDVTLDPRMRASDASASICRRLADIVEANLPGTIADVDTEFLHDLRVAVRRTRSVLKEMKQVFPPDRVEQAKADLRWIQAITGPTRDLDVQLLEWPALVRNVPAAMATDLPPLHDLLVRHRAAAFRTMRRRLGQARYRDAWARWRALLEDVADDRSPQAPQAPTPIVDVAGTRVWSVYKAMVDLGSSIDDDTPAERLHDLRKRGKELRYLLELFGALWPQETVRPLVVGLKGLQDVLGRFQDDEIQTAYLRDLGPELAAAPGGTDSLIALGLVIEALAVDQQEARRSFADRFATFASSRTRGVVRDTFRTSAPHAVRPA